jgi:tRNA-dependent cyclodipeptide synthase
MFSEGIVKNELSIINNQSTKYYRAGFDRVGKSSVVIGMSPGNGYFTIENMVNIIAGICEKSPKVYVIVPDTPHIHNFIAYGYTFSRAKKKAKKDNNQTNNRLAHAADILRNKLNINNFEILNWELSIETNSNYLANTKIIINSYITNNEFQYKINKPTFQYLKSRAKNRTTSDMIISEGVKYYLKELAFFTVLKEVIGEHAIIAYYNQWGEGLDFIEELFPKFSKNFSMIQYQLPSM